MNYYRKSLRTSQGLIKWGYVGSLVSVTLQIDLETKTGHLKQPLVQYVILVDEARLILARAPRRLGVLV